MDELMTRLSPQLTALVALYEHDGHMTSAATALGVPQSSMSRRIHGLEAELGVPLLVPEGRAVRLTRRAKEIASRAREPLRQIATVLDDVAGEGDADSGTVRFGCPLTMGSGVIPELLVGFRRRYPNIRVELKQAHGAKLEADLLAGELDLAVMIPRPEKVPSTVVGTQDIYALLADDHPLVDVPELRLADLADDVFVANPPSYDLRRRTEQWCRDAGFRPEIAMEVTEFGTIRELIARGLGIALLPRAARVPPLCVERRLAGEPLDREIVLARATSTLSPPATRLSDFLEEGFAGAAANR